MIYNEFLDSLSSSYRNLLSKLTSASSESPPGYLYNELVGFIRTDLSKLNEIEDYLISKLSRKEPYIKLKCLKLLKHLCVNFPKDFIRPKVTQSQAIFDCKNYKAPYSEYNGDSLSKLVRAEFEELIKVVCSYDSGPNSALGTSGNTMVGFGNAQYNQPNSYQAPGLGNPNFQSQLPYGSQPTRSAGGYGNPGMMGFGNPNMPPPQRTDSNSFASFASSLTPAVSEIKNAGNNALKMISYAANKYLPSDLVDKIEKVGSAITSTATEQFEKYLGGRTPSSRTSSNTLNNSMYSNRSHSSNYQGGFGSNYTQPNYHTPGPSTYNPNQYNAVAYNSHTQYGQQPPYPHQGYTNPQFGSAQFVSQQSFPNPQPAVPDPGFGIAQMSIPQAMVPQSSIGTSSSYSQGFGAFPTNDNSVGTLSHTSSVGTYNPQTQPSIDLFTNVPSAKFTVAGERESAFVKEMLTFTGIKVSPSPRLIEEYLDKIKDMDKKVVVDELLKHLNVRSAKWQTHFRILCILESLFLRGNLDQATVAGLKKTAVPIFNKCKEEQQLSNKAAKLISLLTNMEGSLLETEPSSAHTAHEPDLFVGQFTAISSTRTDDLLQTGDDDLFSRKESTASGHSDKRGVVDPVEAKANELDLFFNSADPVPVASTHFVPKHTLPKTPEDPFDFDSLSFGNTAPAPKAATPKADPPVVSNIDNNLDLFDNTDFSLDKPDDPFSGLQSKPAAPPSNFDLI